MTLQRLVCRLVLIAIAAGAAVPACAALRMTVTATTTNQANPGATVGPDTVRQSEVVLADGWTSIHTGTTTIVHDFAARRRIVLDETARTRDDYSLFDVVGFRELELRNRAGLRRMAAAAQLEHPLPGQLEDEHELAIQDAPGAPASMRTEGGDQVFASGDITLLRHGQDMSPASAAEAERFVRFLRYAFAGHPAVLAALQKEQGIPARITYYFHPAWGSSTIELKITALSRIDAPDTPVLDAYALRPPAADAASLDELLDHAWRSRSALAAQLKPPTAETLAAQLREQRPLDAFLMMTEQQLAGMGLPPVSDEQKQAFQGDAAVRSLASAVAARDPKAMRQAVGTLRTLHAQAGPRRYLLRLFEANDRVMLGELPAARPLFAEVLQANPALAGAYKDIGDFYFRSFDTARAWRSWELARTLAPMFPNLEPVAQHERTLATRFPEYFQ
jgi:hypothetical protein